MLRGLGRAAARRPRFVVAVGVLFVIVAGVAGAGAEQHLTVGGIHDDGSESQRAARLLQQEFHTGPPNVVLLATVAHGTVDSPAARAAGRLLTTRLARDADVEDATS